MQKENIIHHIGNFEIKVIYSRRRSLGISVLPDSSVIVRVPYLTSMRTITRIVEQKSGWIMKHRESYDEKSKKMAVRTFAGGSLHLFRGRESVLQIEKSEKSFIRFSEDAIELRLKNYNDASSIRNLLYKGYKAEAIALFPEILKRVLKEHESHKFRPSGLAIRSMKRRWGSCSTQGKITLSTELIKLSDKYVEYVIIHELCHLKHHNHGTAYYRLLSELYPDWKMIRKELRQFVIR